MMDMFTRLLRTVRRARTTAPSNEAGVLQSVQSNHNVLETYDTLSMQQIGVASSLPTGSDLIVISVAGDMANAVAIASNHQTHRPKNLGTGETMLYDCGATQQSIHLKADGSVVLTGFHKIMLACDTEIDIQAPLVKITGNLEVTGSIIGGFAGGDQVGLQSHVHGFGGSAPLAGS